MDSAQAMVAAANVRSDASSQGVGESAAAIFDALPAALYTTDADGTITFYNRAAAELAGRRPQIGKDKWCVSWRLRLPDGSELPHDQCPMAQTLRTGEAISGAEIVALRPDGTQVSVMVYPTPMFGSSGELTGAVNMLVDISEKKRSEEATRLAAERLNEQQQRADDATQRLAAIVESSDDAIISKDLNGVIMTWNEGARRLFGYSAEETVGQSIMMLIPPDRQDEEPEILARLRRGERIEHFETVRRRKDGSLIDISLTISPMRNGEGRIVGASKIARDITERKQTQQVLTRRLKEQAALFRLTERLYRSRSAEEVHAAGLDAITDALGCDRASILLFDEAGVMRFVAWRGLSEAYRRAVDGHSPWTLDARDPDPVFVVDAMLADLPQSLKDIVKAEGIGALGFIPLVADGELIGKFMTYYNAPHEFTEAEAGLALTIARQLGFAVQRMRAEQARLHTQEQLRESERRLQMALEAGRMGAWEWNVKSGKVIWSPGVEELHGLEPGTFGGTFEDFRRDIHPEDSAMVEKRIGKALKTRDDYHVVYRIRRPDGAERWVEAFGRFIVEGGEPVQLAGVCMDITERKESELQRKLLVAELSHRVKNTLATVISIARQSFASNPNAKEAQRSFNARIRALGQTHSRLAETRWSGVALETLLTDELAPYSDGANVRLAGPAVLLDPKHALTLGMAVHELATNAAKYGALSASGGFVEAEWTIDSDRQLRIHWRESGGPPVSPPSRTGFGRLLIERVLAADLGGAVQTDFAKAGLTCVITMPLGNPPGAIVS